MKQLLQTLQKFLTPPVFQRVSDIIREVDLVQLTHEALATVHDQF